MKKNQNKSANNEYITRGFFTEHLDMRLRVFKEEIKVDMGEMKQELREEMRGQTAKVLQSVDKILVRFDKAEKDHLSPTFLCVA